ncbi:MAG: hypothetical protein ACK4MD_09145, partial [Demequina sp.]
LRKKGLWVFTFVSVFGFALILSFLSSTSALNVSIGILDRDGGTLAVAHGDHCNPERARRARQAHRPRARKVLSFLQEAADAAHEC